MKSSEQGPHQDVLLTPQECHSSTRLRAFLRLSRLATDDSIKQHLNEIDRGDCDKYFETEIVPQWKARTNVIDYCRKYSEELRKEVGGGGGSGADSKAKNTDFDLRLDPYALKSHEEELQTKYSQIDSIRNWTQNEESIETIVRDQTAAAFCDKCYYRDWLSYSNEVRITGEK